MARVIVMSSMIVCIIYVMLSSSSIMVHGVQLCDGGADVDNTGVTPIGSALQHCFDIATKAQKPLSIPYGIYLLNQTLHAPNGGDLSTTDGATHGTCILVPSSRCATLRAAPSLNDSLIVGQYVSLHYLILDGNRQARPQLYNTCPASVRGHTVRLTGSSQIIGNAFENGVCGSALSVNGSGLTIDNNVFRFNGNHSHMNYADGITLQVSEGTTITKNTFYDNTGSHIASGGGGGLTIKDNNMYMLNAQANAALLLDTLHGPHSSEFYGASFTKNTIDCRGKCYFGIQIGPNPFGHGSPVKGGEVFNNTISGAVVNINVDAATSWTLDHNNFGTSLGHFSSCKQTGTQLNISPSSQVDRKGESTPSATKVTYAGCANL